MGTKCRHRNVSCPDCIFLAVAQGRGTVDIWEDGGWMLNFPSALADSAPSLDVTAYKPDYSLNSLYLLFLHFQKGLLRTII